MQEHEFVLFDRLEVIKKTINKYGEDNFYLSFSGGKDSQVVNKLLDMALPNNKIPRVFCNTGIEYNAIVKFVKALKEQDNRFEIILPRKNIKQTLEEVGYPFKSKEHSCKVGRYQNGSRSSSVMKYKEGKNRSEKYACPKRLLYQYEDSFKLKISEQCCNEFKKKPFKDYQKKSGRSIAITGMMKQEGGEREYINCIVTKNDKVVKFHPLAIVSFEWEEWFINEYQIQLCQLYNEPYNFKRTGCKGCPYSLDLQNQLATMEVYMPNERQQCEDIWKPVYEEYRRIGFRLQNNEQTKLM